MSNGRYDLWYKCPGCGKRFRMADYDNCPGCGKALLPYVCGYCGFASASDMGVCPKCGPSARWAFTFAVFGGMIAGGFAGAFHGVIISGADLQNGALGPKGTAGAVVGGVVGLLFVGSMIRNFAYDAGPKLVAILCAVGLVVGVGVGIVLGPSSHVPINMPDREFMSAGNYGCIGWLCGAGLTYIVGRLRRQ